MLPVLQVVLLENLMLEVFPEFSLYRMGKIPVLLGRYEFLFFNGI